MKVFVFVIVAALLGALAWGFIAGNQPPVPRPAVRTLPVEPAWYAQLAADPVVATEAFLNRVPPETRAHGEAFDGTRYLTLALRVAVLVGSIALIMFTGVAARLRSIAVRASSHRVAQDALFALLFFVILFVLSLPVETYAGFVRIRHAGFSRRSYLDWLADAAIGWAVITTFYVVGVVAIMALIRRRPQSWVAWSTVLYAVLSLVYVLLSPQYIEPLLNSFTPLAEGPDKAAILSLARANGVPANDVFVGDASRQGVLLNAHVSGVAGTARIVLDDNTIASAPPAEVKFVLAHEIGHYVLAHVTKGIVFDSLIAGVGFLFVGWSMNKLLRRYGRRWQVSDQGDIAALPVFWGLFLLWGFISLPVGNSIVREQEAEADLYGLNASRQPFGLAEFMIRDADAERLDPPAIEEWAFYTHPSARNRIFAAMRWRAEHLHDE